MKEHTKFNAKIKQSPAPATSDMTTQWHNIDWVKVTRHVKGLQSRIAKATLENDWRKVKRLQRLLTRSTYAKQLAVRRVTENRGKRTAGVDKVTWSTAEAKWKAIATLTNKGYKPQPLRRVYIISGISKELLEEKVIPVVEEFLKERRLTLSEKKTKVVHIGQGFDFLGWTVRQFNDKLIIKPSKKNGEAFYSKVRDKIKKLSMSKQEDLIKKLNPMIRGWANYHRSQAASQAYGRMDALIWRALWNWSKRRHSKKGKRWVKEKYFKTTATRKWNFGVTIP
ncbi:MAG: reverse transcriptase N-terminal domain-containing protein [Snodgrassella sp.]|nr:reverse transcriptase N-terminal domain-containing protein [Snodgrassella sp.]MCO6555503.1 reverse transcriptase N-terminal domain-containing protein [Gilliamella sp.]